MPPFTFQDAAEIVVPILPWASENPAWSGPSPSEADAYGTLIAFPGAQVGSWCLFHDRAQRHFELTLYGVASPPRAISAHGRRFKVVRAEAGPLCAA